MQRLKILLTLDSKLTLICRRLSAITSNLLPKWQSGCSFDKVEDI